jgi:DNA ligase-1
MNFSKLAQVFSKLEATSSRLEMTVQLSDLFSLLSAYEAKIAAYLAMGELNAQYIGTKFNLAEKALIKVVANLLGQADSTVLLELKKVGDLGSIVSSYDLKAKHEYTILEIYDVLQKIEQISGTGSQELKQQKLYELLEGVDSLSAKYIIRIVLGTLRLGFSQMTVIDALSWMLVGNKSVRQKIEHAYNLVADLGEIAFVAKNLGLDGIKKISIKVGIPIRPAAAERAENAQEIIDRLGYCVAQPKLDGFRLQIHIKKNIKETKVHFFSRNLLDMSNMFPDLVSFFADLNIESLICEGEAIVYDDQTDSFAPFQETVKRRRKHGVEQAAQDLPLKLVVFDILYLNGESLLGKTHHERRQILLSLFDFNNNKKVVAISEVYIKTAQELDQYFMNNITSGLEGIIAKRPDALYQPGKRNFNWIKLKRNEDSKFDDTLDCVILGYYAGQGKRANFGIGAFLVGVYNKHKDQFQTCAKIGTGLKDAQWLELKNKCDKLKILDKPKNVECSKELYPDVWVAPRLVCVVRADEITKSPMHTANKTEIYPGLALRFPRIMSYRIDKQEFDATEVGELKRLFELQHKNKA